MHAIFAWASGVKRLQHASLSIRFSVAAAAVAALAMALAALILSLVWAQQFDAYVREGLQDTANGAATMLGRSHEAYGGWTSEAFMRLPRFGILSGLALQVLDVDGHIIYDDSFAVGATDRIMGPPTGARGPDGPVVDAPIIARGDIVGYVQVWPLSPQGLLADKDVRFRRSSFVGLAIAALIAVAGASLAGHVFSMTFVRPIDRITETAEALRAGDRGARTGMSGDDVIGILGRTLDEMADAIEADRELERRLTADVAHELRTPLQAIQATVEAMQDGVYPADPEHLQIVRDETIRLSRLADGILELTRLECGSVPMRFEPLDAAEPVRAAIDAHRILFDAANLCLDERIDEGIRVNADRDRLTQAIGNLLSNAARYTPAGGSVTVTLRAEGDRAVIEVADTGIGIAEEDAERVFARFWRADQARDRASGGLGIGLAVVREIVERHGGMVGVSRREGGGTIFAIRLQRIA